MTLEEKREKLNQLSKETENIIDGDGFEKGIVYLDGDFDVDELKEIVAIMEAE